jgi:predicted RNase H-like HicB family nuclease
MAKEIVLAVIHEENGSFGISFPDFPGCISGGDTIEEAVSKGAQALAFHIDGMVEDGEELPAIRKFHEIMPGVQAQNDKSVVIAALETELPGKALRINITMEETLLKRIDRAAAKDSLSRSAFLAEAARDRLQKAS